MERDDLIAAEIEAVAASTAEGKQTSSLRGRLLSIACKMHREA
jgi:hypothetical protein